jgi:hypothetical protein
VVRSYWQARRDFFASGLGVPTGQLISDAGEKTMNKLITVAFIAALLAGCSGMGGAPWNRSNTAGSNPGYSGWSTDDPMLNGGPD